LFRFFRGKTGEQDSSPKCLHRIFGFDEVRVWAVPMKKPFAEDPGKRLSDIPSELG
jgi:hypothetical protein